MSESANAGEMTYRRVHQAPPELLFDCMTQPEHLTRFWGPAGTSAPLDGITVDLRPGGSFETVMVSDADGGQYTMRAVYVEVRRPSRLVWTEPGVEGGMTTTITFTDLGGGRTEVVTHQTNLPEAYLQPAGSGRVRDQPGPVRGLRDHDHPAQLIPRLGTLLGTRHQIARGGTVGGGRTGITFGAGPARHGPAREPAVTQSG